MNDTENNQGGQAQPVHPTPAPLVEITLSPEAFYKHLNSVVGSDKVGFGGEDQTKLLSLLLPELKTSDGKPVEFSDAKVDILQLIVSPNEERQRKVMRQTMADAGYVMADETENLLSMMLGTGQFAAFLSKAENPATGKPFIKKSPAKGAKKRTFDTLLKAATKLEDSAFK